MSVENKESYIAEGQQSKRVKDPEQSHLRLLFSLLYVIFEVFLTLFQQISKTKY